jgi:hypothetical protein
MKCRTHQFSHSRKLTTGTIHIAIPQHNMTTTRRLSPQQVRVHGTGQELKKNVDARSQHRCHTARANTQSNTSKKMKKSVQFAATDDSVSTAKYIESPSSFELSDDVKKELWWTREEISDNSNDRKDLVEQFVAKKQDKDKRFVELCRSCASMNVSQVLRSKVNKQLLSDMAGVRGLEFLIFRARTLYRRQHVVSVLSEIGRQDEGDQFVTIKSAQSSRTSQILARAIAQLDAREYK